MRLERTRLSVVALGMLTLLSSCNGIDEMTWHEQVYLHDGTLIYVSRHATARTSGFPNSRRGPTLTQEFSYAPLGVLWKAKGNREQLVSFDIVDGVAFLVSIPPQSLEHFCVGKKTGEYWARYYRWQNGTMQEVSRLETPIAVMRENVTGDSAWGPDNQSDPTSLNWVMVARANMQSGYVPPEKLVDMYAAKSWLRCK